MERQIKFQLKTGNSFHINTIINCSYNCSCIFNKTIEEYVYDGLVEAVVWSMGFIGSEKFVEAIPTFMSNRRGSRQQPQTGNSYIDPLGGAPVAPEENLI
jgi:hypothetical protein